MRAYLLRDFVLPLKGYTLKQLIGNQASNESFRYEEWTDYLKELDSKKDLMAFPAAGPMIYQENLITFHLYEDALPIEEIFVPTMMEANKTYRELSEILGKNTAGCHDPLVFSYGITVGEENCGMALSVTSNKMMFGSNDDPLPITGVTGCTPVCLQIGLSDYEEEIEYPSIRLLGILADPNLDPQTRKERLLTEFDVDIDRNRKEDYEYLTQLEEKKKDKTVTGKDTESDF